MFSWEGMKHKFKAIFERAKDTYGAPFPTFVLSTEGM